MLGTLFVLTTEACEIKGNDRTGLSIVVATEEGEISKFPRQCIRPIAGEGGAGGPARPGPNDASEDSLCGLDWDLQCAFPGTEELLTFVQPVISSQEIPTGSGGEIIPGTYQLESFIEHGDTSLCLGNSGMRRYQALRVGPRDGWLDDEDNHYLHWPLTFSYSTSGRDIDVSITCPYGATVGSNRPYGPFGPFKTYTATVEHLQLFSPACRYQANFRRITP
ncbi:MAG TPA: hypothetical protein VFH73_04405 [Polyangia bacterium]|jgi:hypothetical protein|nr:hypothetical protein [Polyangia bacterium]